MKKLGFTLAEILIAMGILGVITAITIPSIHKISPDKDKGMVLKAFKTLCEINNTILNEPGLYMPNTKIDGTTTDCTNILACTSKPVDGEHETGYAGADKYPHLLSDNMILASGYAANGQNYTFTTTDGIKWSIKASNPKKNTISYTVTIDVGSPSRQTCTYNKVSCKNPRLFAFIVNSDGFVTYGDNLTRVYLENPDNLTERYADLAKAATY